MFQLRDLAFAPLGVAYGAAGSARRALYRAGVLAVERVGAPVVSVGNITAGGTGKTPLVEWLARAAAQEGRRVCILTRGYGRADAGARVVVSDGERVLAGVREGGDEPRLLAESLRGLHVAVVSDANRVAAARWALENLRSEVFILDDGFQHLRIARDLNILTLDATDPWGGGRQLPHGRLREPLGEMRRADLIVITRAELAGDVEDLRARAASLSGGRPVLVARTDTLRIAPLVTMAVGAAADTHETNDLPTPFTNDLQPPPAAVIPQPLVRVPQPLAAFCAIGNSQAFFAHARREGLALNYTRAFKDHHTYTQRDVDECSREAARHSARALLTTAKDAVKLRALDFALPCYVLEVALKFDDEQRMRAVLNECLSRRAVGL
ncbi:MAG: tetraacyldisaccharide 4-kinase [Pyrinomonadaceae bacterium]|jgi:tetraacyldisaccharide 4'-kinase|nr:tetraacyldisaccharide 4-kinase [Pyrinomonadaceae bacterium]